MYIKRKLTMLAAAAIMLSATGCKRFLRESLEDGLSEGISNATAGLISFLLPFDDGGDDD